MDDTLSLAILLTAAGVVLLVGDLFVPSHGAMSVIALGCLGGGIIQAFRYSEGVGLVSLVAVLILLPAFAYTAVRMWPNTFVGRRFAPPNRPVERTESPGYGAALSNLVGQTGVALSLLRPVGECDFDGKRVECIAESGMIERGSKIKALSVQGQSLIVAPV